LAEANNLPFVDLDEEGPDDKALNVIPLALLKRFGAVPLCFENQELRVAMGGPPSPQQRMALERAARARIAPCIARESQIRDFHVLYGNVQPGGVTSGAAVAAVEEIIQKGLRMKASDIHVEPFKDRVDIRYRVDGVLHVADSLGRERLSPLISRIKVMANMNIAEKRAPQDGAIAYKVEHLEMDMRVSVLPSLYGEKVVMRILAGESSQLTMDQVGLSEFDFKRFTRLIHRPYGIVLIVGPTGSGKSTTLAAALNTIKNPGINISTVEEPVEYKIDGITQVNIDKGSDKITFATALRSLLRQDPDVIMVGETRDRETAEISLRAALTGHLVFTTLHTNDAPSAIPRLVDMGCEPFLVGSSVSGVLAQRLVRRLCPRCREAYEPTDEELTALEIERNELRGPWYRARGCRACHNTGYRGRCGIFELLEVDASLRPLIVAGRSAGEIGSVARSAGMRTLRQDAIDKLQAGTTTVQEVFRLTTRE
jgi:type II secretory ATPase GspE/PulE/Tfp pilus assembly ATPase PilB-like protein